jgi:RNA polymerase sigma factor (sigma-70 family)
MAEPPADALIDQLARGDMRAAGALFDAYAPYLRALVRRQLSDQLRAKFDSADVVQSVWVQVVRQLGRDGWRVGSEPELRGLLATIARRRLISRVRKHVGKDADDLSPPDGRDIETADRQARPSEHVQAGDVWEALLRLCPAEHRPVLYLKREGLSSAEIAARTGLHEGSVRRILRRLARELALKQEPLA